MVVPLIFPAQASVAVGTVLTEAEHWPVMFGRVVRSGIGAVVSAITVTKVVQLLVKVPSSTSMVNECAITESNTGSNVTRRLVAGVAADLVSRTVDPSFSVMVSVWLGSGSETETERVTGKPLAGAQEMDVDWGQRICRGMSTTAEQVLESQPSSTVSVTVPCWFQTPPLLKVNTGVALVGSSKVAFGQSVVHW